MGLRSLYRTFNETRKSTRERATLVVTGTSPGAARLARVLNAGHGVRGGEVLLSVEKEEGETRIGISGEAVESPGEIVLPVSLATAPEGELLAELIPLVIDSLSEEFLVPLGRSYGTFRRPVCEELIRKNARQNALVGALPVPGADLPVMTANQGRMVLSIAAVHGEELSLDRARELLGVLGAGLGLRALGRQIVKFVPVAGWAVAAGIGYAGTLAMGQATLIYFERGKLQPGPGEVSDLKTRAIEEAQGFLSRLRQRP